MDSNKIKLSKEQELLIEKLGIMNEKSGIQPAAARIMSLMMVADSTELTFEQIYETLNISKSAASNAINLLLTTNKIDYVTHLGERKRYFRSKLIYWKEDLKHNINQINEMISVLQEVLVLRPSNTVDFNSQLKDVIDFMTFMMSEIPAIFQKWELRKK